MKIKIDGSHLEFKGKSFGAEREVRGEIVFNTAMTGYVETLTDPSYKGQILVLTYPLQGNYGVPKNFHESGKIQIEGLVVANHSENPSHFECEKSLQAWLKSENIPAISGVDTRALTRYLREKGTQIGEIRFISPINNAENSTDKLKQVDMKNVLHLVKPKETLRYGNGNAKILMIDTGAKENMVRSLLKRNATVIRVPWDSAWEDFLPEVDGVFLSNGPGNPLDALSLVHGVRNHLLLKELPVFGICFGHQMIALAAGADVRKMRYGNRSVNQPVKNLLTNRCYITSQNHGYAVQVSSLPAEWSPWFVNINDHTNEGIYHRTKPIRSVQFHPEANPGPNDTAFLFDDFIKITLACKTTEKKNHLISCCTEGVLL